MVRIAFDPHFEKQIRKIKDNELKNRVKKQIEKIIEDPSLGKPMKYSRKGTRELRIPPFRLSYIYLKKKETILLLSFYHKDEQ